MAKRRLRTDIYWGIDPRQFAPLFQPRGDFMLRPADPGNDDGYLLRDGVAIIDIAGPLSKSQTLYQYVFGGHSMPELEQQIRRAAADKAVSAILLRIDSPGGTVAGTSDLADAVYEARKEKRVVAYVSDMAASCAYYVASQADEIYADRDAVVGGIGVYLVVPDYSAAAEEQGIKVHVIKAGKNKGAGVPGAPVTDEHLAEFQREVNQLNETFVDAVARGRGWPVADVEKLNDGRVHVGRYALELGLVDGIATFRNTMTRLADGLTPGSGRQKAAG